MKTKNVSFLVLATLFMAPSLLMAQNNSQDAELNQLKTEADKAQVTEVKIEKQGSSEVSSNTAAVVRPSYEQVIVTQTQAAPQYKLPQMDLDGKVPQEDEKTPKEKIKEAVQKAKQKNADKVAKKLEKVQISDKQQQKMEDKALKEVEKEFNNMFEDGESDAVEVKAAAVQKEEVAVVAAPIPAPVEKVKDFKVIPVGGLMTIKGEGIDFESKISAGVQVETRINSRFSAGLNINYATLDVTEINQDYQGNYNTYNTNGLGGYTNNYGTFSNYSNYNSFVSGYSNTYGSERQLKYNHYLIEANGKVFLLEESKIKPYAGVGLGLNKANLKYTDRGSYTDVNGTVYGNEEFSANYLSGSVALGVEFELSKTIGLNVEGKVLKGFGLSVDSKGGSTNYDQMRLNAIGNAIETSTFTTLNAGMVIAF